MATYQELFELGADSALRNKVAVAAVIKAEGLIGGASPTNTQIAWANNTLRDVSGRARTLLFYVLAANKGSTVLQIQSAADTAIQSNVDTVVDAMIAGGID